MSVYLSPGVYVEEVPSGAAPIAGVGTSTAGFIGLVADDVEMPTQPIKFRMDAEGKIERYADGKPMPIYETDEGGDILNDPEGNPILKRYEIAEENVPQLITSWAAFKNTFGDFQKGNKILAHAVYGFFNNGGTRCWVTRVSETLDPNNVGKALAGFEAIDEIALVAVPGAKDTGIQEAILSHCENMMDRFAILDGQQTASYTKDTVQGGVRTSEYGALYFPWIDVGEKDSAKQTVYVPPSGHMAGIYARVDGERGVHKAPANEVIRGALGVEQRLSKADQDGLNPDGINVIRQFNGNVTVWGARTLGGDDNGEWKYVNVRRLFLFLRESIDEGTQWVVFEPNEPGLWAKITRNVTAFLTNLWRAGALFGDTPEQAFYVKCDEETNPPEVRDLGQVVTEVGVAVVKPAEFVIFRISQWAGPGG